MSAARTETDSKKASTNSQVNRQYFILSLGGMIAAVLLSLFYSAYRSHPFAFFGHPISPSKIAYDFQFIDQDGAVTRLSQWRGHAGLFSFCVAFFPTMC